MPKFSTDTLSRALDSEVADWSSRGYRVVTRSSTSAQLSKPKPPLIFWVVAWMAICAIWYFMWINGLFGTVITLTAMMIVGGAFGVGLLLMLVLYAGLREPLVYLNIGQDGGITQG